MEDKKLIGIYKITSPTGRIYIGQAINIERRIKRYKSNDCKSQSRLFKSINKYGWENHTFEIIEECLEEDLNCRERHWQDFYDSTGKNGLNCVLQECNGERRIISEETKKLLREARKHRVFTEETKQKISKSNMGRIMSEEARKKMSDAKKGKYLGVNNPNYGKKRSKETNDKILKNRRSMKGENNPNYGKKLSEEHIQKLKAKRSHMQGENHPNFGKPLSEERKRIISEANKGRLTYSNSPHAKTIQEVETGIIYGSIREASEKLEIYRHTISRELKKENGKFIEIKK